MNINFILPFAGNKPIGGFKIVYEYANRLSRKGHRINLIHPSHTSKENFLNNTKYLIRYYQRKFDKSYLPKWFNLDKEVNAIWIRSIEDKYIPDADVLIATAWRTAKCALDLNASKGKKFYFIQHYETWNGPEEEVNATWKMPYTKIVIAKWLKEIAELLHEEAHYIPNGLNFDEFGIDQPPEKRIPEKVMMLYSELKFKGSDIGIKALIQLKNYLKNLQVILFGVPKRPANLPAWIEYYQSPDRKLLRSLYNQTAIFLSPSISEGFGLTSAEAMMCGAALIASETSGHKEFAINGSTALTFEPGKAEKIVEKGWLLIKDRDLRIKLAKEGHEYVKKFTWEKAVNDFEKVLTEN